MYLSFTFIKCALNSNFNNKIIWETECIKSIFFSNNFEDNYNLSYLLFFNVEFLKRIKSAEKSEETMKFYINYCSTVYYFAIENYTGRTFKNF